MPVVKKGSKWAIGSGPGRFKSKAAAERAWAAVRAKKHGGKKK